MLLNGFKKVTNVKSRLKNISIKIYHQRKNILSFFIKKKQKINFFITIQQIKKNFYFLADKY